MLAAQFCREVRFGVLAGRLMQSRVPRCLFGPPDSKETLELVHDVMDSECVRFQYRWGIDPRTENKEYIIVMRPLSRLSPKKRRVGPYAKQTSIHGKSTRN